MTLLEIFLIGIGLSMDAFAVAICKGLAMPDKVHKRSAFLIALYFGVFQAVMPALGWLLGSQFAHYVTRFAPWIAFVLLAWIGGNMIRESRAGRGGRAALRRAGEAQGAAGAGRGHQH